MADQTPPPERECPYCLEPIKAKAIKCRYCGSDLEEDHLAPVVKRSGSFMVYVLAALVGLAAVGVCVYIALRPDDEEKKEKVAKADQDDADEDDADEDDEDEGSDDEADEADDDDEDDEDRAARRAKKRRGKSKKKVKKAKDDEDDEDEDEDEDRKSRRAKGKKKSKKLRVAAATAAPPAPPVEKAAPSKAAEASAPKNWQRYQGKSPAFAIRMPRAKRLAFKNGKYRVQGLLHKGKVRSYVLLHHQMAMDDTTSDGILSTWARFKRKRPGRVLKKGWIKFNNGQLAFEALLLGKGDRIYEVKICAVDRTVYTLMTETDTKAPGYGSLTQDAYRFFGSFASREET